MKTLVTCSCGYRYRCGLNPFDENRCDTMILRAMVAQHVGPGHSCSVYAQPDEKAKPEAPSLF